MADNVNHPSHYTYGLYETIDMIKSILSYDEYIGYCHGNALKYTVRCKHKGHAVEDLQKSVWYHEEHVKTLEMGRDKWNAMWHPNERLED